MVEHPYDARPDSKSRNFRIEPEGVGCWGRERVPPYFLVWELGRSVGWVLAACALGGEEEWAARSRREEIDAKALAWRG